MKKLFVLALVLGLLLAMATPVAARGGGGSDVTKLYGTIIDITSDETFDILVDTPLRYAGDTITVQATGDTRIKECDDGSSSRITFNDLEAGWAVRVTGSFVDGVIVATTIIQYVP